MITFKFLQPDTVNNGFNSFFLLVTFQNTEKFDDDRKTMRKISYTSAFFCVYRVLPNKSLGFS